jgi:hypothetical protein
MNKGKQWVVSVLLSFLAFGAQAEDWKVKGAFGWMGVGKVYELDKGHIVWIGEFGGTFFNDQGPGSPFHDAGVRCPGSNEFDFNRGRSRANGYCIVTDSAGDQAFLSWELAGDTHRGAGTFRYTGGTGKYAGIAGDNAFTGATEVNWKDGMSTGYSIWNR